MKTSEKEKLWNVSIQDGRAKVFRNNIPLKSNHNGQEYGFLLGVTVKVQSAGNKLIQVRNNLRCIIFKSYFEVMSLHDLERLFSSLLCLICKFTS